MFLVEPDCYCKHRSKIGIQSWHNLVYIIILLFVWILGNDKDAYLPKNIPIVPVHSQVY